VFIKIDFGVRQGSVLSPRLFAVYVDDIVTRLHASQHCFIVLLAVSTRPPDGVLLAAAPLAARRLQCLASLVAL